MTISAEFDVERNYSKSIPDLKLSPCSEYCMLSSG